MLARQDNPKRSAHERAAPHGNALSDPSKVQDVITCVDTMFVNKLPFLMTVSKGIKFITAECVPNRQEDTILATILRIKKMHNLQIFWIRQVNADPEFEKLRADLADNQIALETVADDEHVPETERCIHTTKERARALWNLLQHNNTPNHMTIEFILNCVTWLNMFPPLQQRIRQPQPPCHCHRHSP